MKIISLIFSFVLIIFFSQNALSQTGCYVASQNRLYIDTGNLNNCAYYYTYCPNDDASGDVASVSPTGSTSCFVCNLQSGNGVQRGYTATKCPLDDYIWLVILPLSLFGFQFIRRKIQIS